MRPGLQLKVAFAGVVAEIIVERPLNVDWMGVMSFDEVAVIAIHCPHQIGQCGDNAFRQTTPKAGGACRQFHGQIVQCRTVNFGDPANLSIDPIFMSGFMAS